MRMIPLGDIATVELSNIDKKCKAGEPDVILCNFVDVYHNWQITKETASSFMAATASNAQVDKFALHKGQVAITKDSETRDDIGVATYIAEDIDTAVLGYHCALITPDENIVTGEYLNLIMHTPYTQKFFEMNASGSGQRYTLTKETIEAFPVPVPDMSIQKSFGKLVSSIDKKIQLNNSICSDLEGMAKLLYDYWFVQFDFPDENGKPYKSNGGKMVWNDELKREIPEGWEVEYLGNVCQTLLGGTPSTKKAEYWDGDIPWLNSGEVAVSPVLTSEKTITEEGMNNSATSFAKAGAIVMSITRYIRPSILAMDACFNQSVVAVIPNDDLHTEYLYPFMVSQINRYMGLRTGAQQPHINKEIVDDTLIICPIASTLSQYYEKVNSLYSKQILLSKETQELTSLRDFLLPMLMNGQVKVGKEGA